MNQPKNFFNHASMAINGMPNFRSRSLPSTNWLLQSGLLLLLVLLSFSMTAQGSIYRATTADFRSASLAASFEHYEIYEFDIKPLNSALVLRNQYNFTLQLGDTHEWPLNITHHDLRSPNYQEVAITDNGYEVLPPRRAITYQGYLNADQVGEVRLSINKRYIMGFVTVNGQQYYIEPLNYTISRAASNLYIVYKPEDIIHDGPLECGVRAVNHQKAHQHENFDGPSRIAGACKEVDFLTATPFDMFEKFGSVQEVNDHIQTITNMVEPYYAFAMLDYIIVQQFVPTTEGSDPFTSSTVAGDLLSSMQTWAGGGGIATHDIGQLWVDRDIVGCNGSDPDTNTELIGCANIGVVCNSNRYNVCEDINSGLAALTILSAHELGHNWDARHADANGNDDNIMFPSLDAGDLPTGFGGTEQAVILAHVNSRGCLADCGTPSNDLCAGAITLGCGDSESAITSVATADDAPIDCPGGGLPNAGVWFRFIGTGDIVTISTAGSAFDTQLNLYEGSCGNLTCVAGDDDGGPGTTSEIEFCSVNGTTYYIYLDGFGGSTGTYFISIECTPDVTPPSITCPANVTTSNDAGQCGAIVNYSAASASDMCGFTISYTQNAGTFFPVGATNVTATATDVSGNSNFCNFTVTVNDTEAPTAVCLNNTVFLQPDGMYTFKNEDVLNIAASFDNCSFSVTNISPPKVDCDDANMILPVEVTITDPAGNSDNCTANITVLIGTALPAPWVGTDIGNPGTGNNYEYDPCIPPLGEFTIDAGATNNSIPNDNLAFINQTICGDFQIDAKLESVSNGYGGLLIRENNSPGSKMVGMYSNLSTIVRWESRMMTNGPKQLNAFNRPFPIWLRLVRQGDWVFGYISTNGVNYNPVHGNFFPAGACAQIGMSAFNYVTGSTATAIFSNVVVGLPSMMAVEPPTLPESVNTYEDDRGIRAELFPNPTTQQLMLRFYEVDQQALELRLYNSQGQLQSARQLEAISGPIRWDVQDLPPGVYLINARFADGTQKVLRFIKE
jgi:hypothetical protein